MKATIKRVTELAGKQYYQVLANDSTVGVFIFKEDAPRGDAYNETDARHDARKLAEKIEKSDGEKVEEIVYQTPDTE